MPHRIAAAREVERRVIDRRRHGTQNLKSEYSDALGPPPWPMHIRLHYYRVVAKQVFWLGDTTTVRAILAFSSALFSLLLCVPQQVLTQQAFFGMTSVAPLDVWAAAFLLHSVGVVWRFVALKPSIPWAWIVNAYGLALWIIYIILNVFSIGGVSPSAAMEMTMVIAAGMSLVRTGLNDEVVSP